MKVFCLDYLIRYWDEHSLTSLKSNRQKNAEKIILYCGINLPFWSCSVWVCLRLRMSQIWVRMSVSVCPFGCRPLGAFLHMYGIEIRQLHLSVVCLLCTDSRCVLFLVQVLLTDTNTQFVEQTIAIMKNLLDNHTEGSSEHLGQASIETMMLNLVR